MKELTIFLSKSLVGWLAIQTCLALVFLFHLRTRRRNTLPDERLPKTAVILSLRGADPFLPDCLQALCHQNYPEYDLKIIVDSEADPACQIVHNTIQAQNVTNVQVSSLKIIRHNCSLKCSAILQAISELDDSYKVVALVDADTIVNSHWLRELVSPLLNPQVGVTTGNRWFIPTGNYWGSLVRYIGNISTVVQMYLFGVPWGGSLAIKTEVLQQTGILEKWGQTLSEDLILPKILKEHGLRIQLVPSLIILNREECDLLSLTDALERLILSSRLYHPCWFAIIGDAISSILIPSLTVVLFLISLLDTQWDLAFLLFTTYWIYSIGLLLLTLLLDLGVQTVIRSQEQPGVQLTASIIGRILLAIPLTQWVYGLVMMSSLSISTLKWRGIIYRIEDPWNIHLVEYHPYTTLDQPIDQKFSL